MSEVKRKNQNTILNTFYVLLMYLVLTALVVLTHSRNDRWFTKLSIWLDAAQKSPAKARVYSNIGVAYKLLGKYDEALVAYKRANDLNYKLLVVYSNLFDLGATFDKQGNYYQAVTCYNIVCANAPSLFHKEKQFACERIAILFNEKNLSKLQ